MATTRSLKISLTHRLGRELLMSMPVTYQDLHAAAVLALAAAGISSAPQEAWWLLERAAEAPRASILAIFGMPCGLVVEQRMQQLLRKRCIEKIPLQYVLGTVPFAGLTLTVRPPTLIPRPETEEMVAWIIDQFAPLRDEPLRVADLCAGSGCIALALAAAFPAWQVVGVDISVPAIELAEENRLRAGLNNVVFVRGDFLAPLREGPLVDLIVSNPPYISQASYDLLDDSVKNFEDKFALYAPQEGMHFYHELLGGAEAVLNPASAVRRYDLPNLVCEFGVDQEAIQSLAERYGASNARVHRDLQGVERWLAVLI